MSRLIDSLPADLVKGMLLVLILFSYILIYLFVFTESLEEPQNCLIDINELTIKISQSVLSREYLETRHRTVDDDGLIGLLNLLTNLVKHRPPFQTSKQGQELLSEVCNIIFIL